MSKKAQMRRFLKEKSMRQALESVFKPEELSRMSNEDKAKALFAIRDGLRDLEKSDAVR